MTSPTGPDRDRLRASDAGQETCGRCHHVRHDGRCQHKREIPPSGVSICLCPAPQQPPAQEREYRSASGVISESMVEVEARIAADEAASAGELCWCGHGPDRHGYEAAGCIECPCSDPIVRRRAASSGVRGGDDQARERLADVLDTCDVLDRVSDADDMTGPFGRDAARIRRAAVETIRRAAGGGRP